MFGDSGVESVAVVQPAGDECLRDDPSGVVRQSFEDLLQHASDMEAGGAHCVDLSRHVELVV